MGNVSHKRLQAAIKDLNEALGLDPKLRVIGVTSSEMEKAIVEVVASLHREEIERLEAATVETYNELVTAMEYSDDDVKEEDCFSISYDPENPACAVTACSQAQACAEIVTGKKRKQSARGAMLDFMCRRPQISKQELVQELEVLGFNLGVHYKKTTLDTVYSDCRQIFSRLGLLEVS